MVSILVVEDNKNLRILMSDRLEMEGYKIFQSENGEKALEVLESNKIDLLITDIMMPTMDGYELIDILRKSGYNVPVLMVTAKDSFEDKEMGFRLGTDDYMVKPININEMILRVSALLRRAQIINENILKIGDIILNSDTLTVDTGEEVYELPKKEFYLLYKLLSYPKKIFTRQQLLDDIWGMDTEVDERTVDSHIKKLRRKFSEREEFKIVTIRGLGYKVERYV
ncbi:response regulator transcription factor [Clostridium gasigenes]|uniref:Heme response regulator HssR n=1 Tax=Clostridium gasigenes TaxID=94869 RepID=A0A1H0VV11_9CLOT|nr:response regulator transcription factor [Clostridium gasigenes]MBB6625444.1 response regulator transcription factor [Clostridium gasigenes]MBB6714859.1 response regulator transcription factor [Clostridium gasigenes]MBU3089951.1 response regulator transcription factor [Clostridium gasigenes]MBU3105080.1 response regulator transcription factor [Clostridium gasigenes]MBU3107525.1 response regulator transcription factor [Clostridium gasigenes]